MLDSDKRHRLLTDGWKFRGEGPCKVSGCKARVEYWQEPRKGIAILDVIGLRPHWTTCTGTIRARLARGLKTSQLPLFPEKTEVEARP